MEGAGQIMASFKLNTQVQERYPHRTVLIQIVLQESHICRHIIAQLRRDYLESTRFDHGPTEGIGAAEYLGTEQFPDMIHSYNSQRLRIR